ncbi:MAG: radical SAM protein [Rhodospirillales bacterium]
MFHVELIKPSHYDDDGYVIQWRQALIPSNSLACLYSIAREAASRKVLGPGIDIDIHAYDETNTVIPVNRIIHRINDAKDGGIVCFVGVQSNQFPRAMDLARRFRTAGIDVVIGGFHVSGCIAMLDELPADIQEARDLGISLFAGEAEGRLDEVIIDAHSTALKPIYNHMSDLPGLEGATTPYLPAVVLDGYKHSMTSFDAGRGCPFQCSFCTIINVQGRKSRYRSADDVEAIVRRNHQQGVTEHFITDDNFARNKNWEKIFDRLIWLREDQGMTELSFVIQVDTLCHKIPNFIQKAKRAGCWYVFIGLENINQANLQAANKRQNRIAEYRALFQAWRNEGIITYAGYILGFPADTPESIAQDIEVIQRELPVDLLEFFVLTPLPGSADHKNLHDRGIPMDPDMNNYDLEHMTVEHPLMSAETWSRTYHDSWRRYYSLDHAETLLRRAAASGIDLISMRNRIVEFYGTQVFENVHPLQGGIIRRKVRRERRPTFPREPAIIFYPRYLWQTATTLLRFLLYQRKLTRIVKRIKRDPEAVHYRDAALTPVAETPAETEFLTQYGTRNAENQKTGTRARAAS